ncbi:HAMP domain-containing histidine kinase [Alphaproteobacteria bacterium]|nr:HAMP domain-containing histidine kinase [Alphaproteobacteria bacterium]
MNNYRKLALYNFPLSIQILAINLFITCIGFIILILFNFYLINNDNTIQSKKINANEDLKKIQSFLEKNAIIRVPVFDDACIGENNLSCEDKNNIKLSDPILEPKITQEFILNNFLNSEYDIKIYNDDWIRLVDTLDLYEISIVEEVDIQEIQLKDNDTSLYQYLTQKYLSLFSTYHNLMIKRKFGETKTEKKSEVSYVSQSIKDRTYKEYIVVDGDNILYQYLTFPIISNGKVYGVAIISYLISNQSSGLALISLNIFIFYILFVLIMIFMSLIFSKSLVTPIKRLSKLTILERERVNENEIIYPHREDEIGTLSKEIQNMSLGLKSQIEQLEKFSADVSHELKNPLTSLQSAIDLIDTNNIAADKKNLLINNIKNDLKRMNQLITDISNFTRLKAEIELEKNQYIKLNNFLDEIPEIFTNNNKEIKLIFSKHKDDLEILANKNKLIQVFINLIENSISLSPKKSKILIELDKIDNKYISLRFHDQGKGINSKDSEKIFERFYSDRHENIKNHTGLGLSIASEIIGHMNGKISLDKSSKSDYPGACFLIILPVRHSS